MNGEKSASISTDFFENSDRIERIKMYEFTVSFNALIKSLRLYGAENDTVEKNVAKLAENIEFFFVTDALMSFTFNGVDFFINDMRVKRKKGSMISFEDAEDFFTQLQIETIFIEKATKMKEIVNFIVAGQETLKKRIDNNLLFDRFEQFLRSHEIKIDITQRDISGEDDVFTILDKSQLARLTYRNMISDQTMFKNKIKKNRPMPLRKAMRNVQNIIDLICDGSSDSQESHILVLTAINSLQNKIVATHMTNTTILSVAAGVQLGIDRSLLTRIGMAAYFHDIALPAESQGENFEHNQNGFAVLSRLNSLNFAMMEAAITAGLHHATYDFDCKPIPPEKPIVSTPLGELIKVCDFYDLATRWWPARKKTPLKRAEAMTTLFKMAEIKCFAPVAVKALFSALGVYPPGTVLKVLGRPWLACSLDVFRNTGRKGKAAILDKNLNLLDIQAVYPYELTEIPQSFHFKLPPKTVKKCLDSFSLNLQKKN